MYLYWLSIPLLCFVAIPATAHNYVVCSNAYPDIDGLLSTADRKPDMIQEDQCQGYPRAFPAQGTPERDNYNEQAWPWQGIWPLHDHAALTNHRVSNWLQENPVYDPSHKEARVKPESTVLVQIQTNNHNHEWKLRQPGRHLIFLAGKSGTQFTTANQLTWDRLVFSAPSCKYAHIIGEPNAEYGGFSGNPGYSWAPLKLVDPTGAWLPEGTYNFIFAYFWSTGDPDLIDYMIPQYSHSFDITIASDANSTGAVSSCVENDPNCHQTLVGNNSCPGAKDTTPPWPPYADEGKYLFTNPDGADPTTPNGQRTFQPYWQEYVEASPMPDITYEKIKSISAFNEDELLNPVEIAGGNVTFPGELKEYPYVLAGKTWTSKNESAEADYEKSIPVTQKYVPMSIAGTGGSAGSSGSDGPATGVDEPLNRRMSKRRHSRHLQG